MSRYSKIETRIWNDRKFVGLSHTEQLVFLFLLTHPNQTSVGAMRATLDGLATELQMNRQTFRSAMKNLAGLKMVTLDEKASYIDLVNFIRYNLPENPNSCKAWASAIQSLPECEGRDRLVGRCWEVLQTRKSSFRHAFVEGFAGRFPEPLRERLAEESRPGSSNPEPEPEPYIPPIPPSGGRASAGASPKTPGGSEKGKVSDSLTHVNSSATDTINSRFDEFWSVYPRKIGKGQARKIWGRLKPSAELLGRMLAAVALQSQMEQWRKDGGQYIPHPGTWLNQGRWDDEVKTAEAQATEDWYESHERRFGPVRGPTEEELRIFFPGRGEATDGD